MLKRGRPMAGNVILSSRHFPDDVQGTHLNNQSIGFHGTRWDRLIEDGSGWKTEALPDMIQSTDFSFRPVASAIGPDGALYILDFCNPRIGHMQFTHRDPNRELNPRAHLADHCQGPPIAENADHSRRIPRAVVGSLAGT